MTVSDGVLIRYRDTINAQHAVIVFIDSSDQCLNNALTSNNLFECDHYITAKYHHNYGNRELPFIFLNFCPLFASLYFKLCPLFALYRQAFESEDLTKKSNSFGKVKYYNNCKCNCNVRQKTLQKFLKISIKNSKCATSNKHIQDGRLGRYENRRGSKIKAKHHQKIPPTTQERECPRCHHPEGVRIRNSAI